MASVCAIWDWGSTDRFPCTCPLLCIALTLLYTEGIVAVIAASEAQQPEVASWLPEASQDLPLHVLRDVPALLQVCWGI